MVEHVGREPLQDHLQALAVDLLGLHVVQVEVGHLVRDDAAADPEVEAAARELVEHAHFLDEPERVIERQAVDAGAEADARVRWVAAARKMPGTGASPSGVAWCSAR
jgi:hypothetical protein